MEPPSLPPKPSELSNRQSPPQTSPSIRSPGLNHGVLDGRPVLSPSGSQNGVPAGRVVAAPLKLPESLSSLPSKSLEEFARSHELLLGYIYSLKESEELSDSHEEEINKLVQRLDALLKENVKTKMPQRQREIADSLEVMHAKEKEWQTVEKEMYAGLKKFSTDYLIMRLKKSVAEADALCNALAETWLEGPRSGYSTGSGSNVNLSSGNNGFDRESVAVSSEESDLVQFIRSYRSERKIYYLRKERVDRWEEGAASHSGYR